MKTISVIPRLFRQNLHHLDTKLLEIKSMLEKSGWEFYAVSYCRGYCEHFDKVITIPEHAFEEETSYLNWYLAHEMAHAYAGLEAKHGPRFMKELQRICPPEYIHHELTYQPKNALLAGIQAEDF